MPQGFLSFFFLSYTLPPFQLYQMVSRSPVRDSYGRAKVVIGKPGVFYRPPKSSGHVIGGHRYWQGKMNADIPTNGSGKQNLKRSGRSPRRQSPAYTIEGQQISQTPTQRLMHSQSLSLSSDLSNKVSIPS